MLDYYELYIKPKEILKDINYFFDQIKDLICNNLFAAFLYNKRRKINIEEYTIDNYLSNSNTRLIFNNDRIIVNFKISKIKKSNVFVSKLIYKDRKIDNMILNIDVVISPQEEKSKIIYEDNIVFRMIRKHIHNMNEFYINKIRKSEESKYKIIYNKLSKLKPSFYSDWNKFHDLILDCTDPYYNENLHKFDDIIRGTNCTILINIYKMIHNTQFYQKYAHRQIRYGKFIISLRKECLDECEIIDLSNKLASCFGHTNKNYNESLNFIENMINHFNIICHVRETKIDTFTTKIWLDYQKG